mgnify:CR=1 FL=1
MQTRRSFLTNSAALGAITVLPFSVNAAGHQENTFKTDNGAVTITPVSHASFVMETPAGVIYVDPVGDSASYDGLPAPHMILITHQHGDHYNADTLNAVTSDTTTLIANPAVYEMLPADMMARATQIANGENTAAMDVTIEAVPAYNTTEERLNFHPKGRDNGYVVTVDGMRIYISGDTEGHDEMRALKDIDLAFVCMNLPFTMDAEAAADAVSAFAPTYVYPYHYRGRDNGTQDPQEFADMVSDAINVKFGGWYG